MASKSFLSLALGAFLPLSAPAGFGSSDALAQGCLSQSEVRAVVASGQAQPLSQFSGRLRLMGDVVSSCLVDRGGSYAYVVSIVQANGQVTQVVLNARTGQ